MAVSRDRTPAHPGDEMLAQHVFGDEWRQMTPQEWLARHFHESVLWPFSDKIYSDSDFDDWLCQVNAIIWPPDRPLDENGRRWPDYESIERLRQQHLTANELAVARRQMAEPL